MRKTNIKFYLCITIVCIYKSRLLWSLPSSTVHHSIVWILTECCIIYVNVCYCQIYVYILWHPGLLDYSNICYNTGIHLCGCYAIHLIICASSQASVSFGSCVVNVGSHLCMYQMFYVCRSLMCLVSVLTKSSIFKCLCEHIWIWSEI